MSRGIGRLVGGDESEPVILTDRSPWAVAVSPSGNQVAKYRSGPCTETRTPLTGNPLILVGAACVVVAAPRRPGQPTT